MRRTDPQYFAIQNVTGAVAKGIIFTISGDVVAGVAGYDETQWKRKEPLIGNSVEVFEVFVRSWGGATPTLHITWTAPDGEERCDQVEIPFRDFRRDDLKSPIPPGSPFALHATPPLDRS
ncbi:hypothetical protein BHQ19_25120 [Mycolicibacterium porcinum]|nr:hypothetical protein BHQ19_25120 [Mycolicibacterium porcinum]